MRKLRTMSLLAFAAIVAAMFAGPTAASAVEWTQAGKPLETSVTVKLGGNTKYSLLGAGYECEVQGEATLSPGDKGTITSFKIIPQSCKGSAGHWQGCKAESVVNPGAMPIQAVAEGSQRRIRVSGFSYRIKWFACSDGLYSGKDWRVTAEGKDLDWGPNSYSAMSSWGLGGQVKSGFWNFIACQSECTWLPLEGSLALTPAGAYGIS